MSYDCEYDRSASPDEKQRCTPPVIEQRTPVVEEDKCTEDTWECGDWGECSQDGVQTRDCRMSYDCEYTRSTSPETTQRCTPKCTEDIWECGDWSECSQDGVQTRDCRMSYDCEYDRSASPDEKQSCTPPRIVLYPDLSIISMAANTDITAGDSVSFYGAIENKGTGDAAASTAYIYIDGKAIGRVDVASMVAGGQSRWSAPSVWTATAGAHTYQVCLDGPNTLAESDETNNCVSGRMSVAEATTTRIGR